MCNVVIHRMRKAFRLNDLFGEIAAIGCTWLGVVSTRRAIGLFLSMDCRNGRLKVLQFESELLGIGLLGSATEGSLFESRGQLLKPLIAADFARSRAHGCAF
jgi:predicted nucleic acid-binding protein